MRPSYNSVRELPGPPPKRLVRFLDAHKDQPTQCWPWPYGVHSWAGPATVRTRRLSYLLTVGDIEPGLVLVRTSDCPTEGCLNPRHLEPVEYGGWLRNRRRLLCDQGHEIGEDEYRHRQCSTCKRAHGRAAEALIARAAQELGLSRSQYRRQHRRSLAVAASLLGGLGIDPLQVLADSGLDPDRVLDGSPALRAYLETGQVRTYRITSRMTA